MKIAKLKGFQPIFINGNFCSTFRNKLTTTLDNVNFCAVNCFIFMWLNFPYIESSLSLKPFLQYFEYNISIKVIFHCVFI